LKNPSGVAEVNNAGWAAVTAIAATIGAFVGGLIESKWHERELDIKMIEIAIGLLKEDPKGPLQPARDWGVDLIAKYSDKVEVPLSKDAQAALKSEKVDVFSRIGERAMGAIGAAPIGVGPIGAPPARP
jgi:hypothetical protein